MAIKIDSRDINPGDFFIPVKGKNHDGKEFIEEVKKKGGIILDVNLQNYAKEHRKKLKAHIIGITGSAGKTTVKDLIESVLSVKYKVKKTKENQNNEIGVPLTLLSAEEDTEVVVVEMGVRKKRDMKLLEDMVHPTHVVITGIGITHAEFLKNSKEIAEEKGTILQPSQPWLKGIKKAYIQKNDQTAYLIEKATQAGFEVSVYSKETREEENKAVARQIGKEFGLTESEIEKGLSLFQSSSNRMKYYKVGEVTLIDDTYNANPDGVRYALEVLKKEKGNKAFILGSMLELGEHSKQIHQDLLKDIKEAGVTRLYTIGKETEHLTDEDLPIIHYNPKGALISEVRKELNAHNIWLIKGSRGLKLEEVVQCLRQQ